MLLKLSCTHTYTYTHIDIHTHFGESCEIFFFRIDFCLFWGILRHLRGVSCEIAREIHLTVQTISQSSSVLTNDLTRYQLSTPPPTHTHTHTADPHYGPRSNITIYGWQKYCTKHHRHQWDMINGAWYLGCKCHYGIVGAFRECLFIAQNAGCLDWTVCQFKDRPLLLYVLWWKKMKDSGFPVEKKKENGFAKKMKNKKQHWKKNLFEKRKKVVHLVPSNTLKSISSAECNKLWQLTG